MSLLQKILVLGILCTGSYNIFSHLIKNETSNLALMLMSIFLVLLSITK